MNKLVYLSFHICSYITTRERGAVYHLLKACEIEAQNIWSRFLLCNKLMFGSVLYVRSLMCLLVSDMRCNTDIYVVFYRLKTLVYRKKRCVHFYVSMFIHKTMPSDFCILQKKNQNQRPKFPAECHNKLDEL